HDVTRLIPEPCPCGRTLRRIERIRLRTDDMLVIRGVNVFLSQIETALLAVEGTLPHYQIILTTDRGLDRLEVQVEVTSALFSTRLAPEGLARRVEHDIKGPALASPVPGQARRAEDDPAQRGEGEAGSTRGSCEPPSGQ
ncbi:MAG: hypothetical protein M5T61_21250, partial [Acidimicrobiia bacterium]|nr:hypothetical protein [Acidimicrobiia bacterium]